MRRRRRAKETQFLRSERGWGQEGSRRSVKMVVPVRQINKSRSKLSLLDPPRLDNSVMLLVGIWRSVSCLFVSACQHWSAALRAGVVAGDPATPAAVVDDVLARQLKQHLTQRHSPARRETTFIDIDLKQDKMEHEENAALTSPRGKSHKCTRQRLEQHPAAESCGHVVCKTGACSIRF